MKVVYGLKLIALVLALVGVLAIIRGMSAGHVEHFFQTFGGDAAQIESRPRKSTFQLCSNRVHAIIWPDGRKIEELKQGLKMKWRAFDPEPREIGYIAMEKWLGENCRLSVLEMPAVPAEASFQDGVVVEFIDGSRSTLQSGPGDLFRVNGRTFQSPELSQAFRALRELAQLGPATP